MAAADVLVYRDQQMLAAAGAARLITRLSELQATRRSASVVLTGGGTGIAVLEQLRHAPARDAIDWSRLDIYWGDERFVPSTDHERNEKQAREALLEAVPIEPHRVHAMPAAEEYGGDPDAAAGAYAELLRGRPAGEPLFDVMLLGLGPEGHTASIFPDSPAVYERDRAVVGVRDCPKPPPTRVSLTLPTIRRSSEVWLMAAGGGKADAVALALSGAPETQLPVAGARGLQRTLWLIDEAAAGKLDRAR